MDRSTLLLASASWLIVGLFTYLLKKYLPPAPQTIRMVATLTQETGTVDCATSVEKQPILATNVSYPYTLYPLCTDQATTNTHVVPPPENKDPASSSSLVDYTTSVEKPSVLATNVPYPYTVYLSSQNYPLSTDQATTNIHVVSQPDNKDPASSSSSLVDCATTVEKPPVLATNVSYPYTVYLSSQNYPLCTDQATTNIHVVSPPDNKDPASSSSIVDCTTSVEKPPVLATNVSYPYIGHLSSQNYPLCANQATANIHVVPPPDNKYPSSSNSSLVDCTTSVEKPQF